MIRQYVVPLLVPLVLFVFFFGSCASAISNENRKEFKRQKDRRDLFYDSCLQDRKRYECDYMWGQIKYD